MLVEERREGDGEGGSQRWVRAQDCVEVSERRVCRGEELTEAWVVKELERC